MGRYPETVSSVLFSPLPRTKCLQFPPFRKRQKMIQSQSDFFRIDERPSIIENTQKLDSVYVRMPHRSDKKHIETQHNNGVFCLIVMSFFEFIQYG